MPKASRRLSARFTGWAKGLGKKEQTTTPKDELAKEAMERKIHEPMPVSDEAPKLDQPVLAEPIQIDEVSTRCIRLYHIAW